MNMYGMKYPKPQHPRGRSRINANGMRGLLDVDHHMLYVCCICDLQVPSNVQRVA